jgi:hypothetical protein
VGHTRLRRLGAFAASAGDMSGCSMKPSPRSSTRTNRPATCACLQGGRLITPGASVPRCA